MQNILILISIIGLVCLYRKYKQGIGQQLIIAALITFAWVSWSGIYHYSGENFYFLGINLFAFILWTAGLVIYREVYEKLNGKNRFAKAVGIWVGGLLLLEYIGYHVMGIRLAGCYSGTFGLDVLHVPLFAKIFYLSVGPTYLKITDYLRVR